MTTMTKEELNKLRTVDWEKISLKEACEITNNKFYSIIGMLVCLDSGQGSCKNCPGRSQLSINPLYCQAVLGEYLCNVSFNLKMKKQKRTNADKFRDKINVYDLCDIIIQGNYDKCKHCLYTKRTCGDKDCTDGVMEWLEKECDADG